MRVMANYGCKNGTETYSVSVEMMGDASKQNIEGTIDELFGVAKEAVKRQIEGGTKKEENPRSELPASRKQKDLIIRLAKERGKFIENLNSLTIGEATKVIEDLKKVPARQEAPA